MIRFIFCGLLSLCIVARNAATTVVVVWKKGQIIVATDSRMTDSNRNYLRSECKIVVTDSFVFAMVGLTSDVDFDMREIARRVSREEGALQTKVEHFQQVAAPKLQLSLERLKMREPLAFSSWMLKTQGGLTQAVFVRVADKTPQVLLATFKASEQIDGIHLRNEIQIAQRNEGFLFMGTHTHIDKHGDEFPKENGLTQWAAQLIEVEIGADPAEVGGPVDVVQLDERGAKWIQAKGCVGE